MTRKVVLREIAHARAGDKGDTSNVAVFVYDPAHYPAVKAQLTAERIKAWSRSPVLVAETPSRRA